MSRVKDETLSIRTFGEIKQLLRMAADRERCTVALTVDILVLEYAQNHNLSLNDPSGQPKTNA